MLPAERWGCAEYILCQSQGNKLALIALRGVKQTVCIVKPSCVLMNNSSLLQAFDLFADPNMTNCAHLKDLYPEK
eukprot:s1616_g2.t1